MVFHWSLSDSKSTQVSRTLLGILAVLNKAVVWMVPSRPFIFNSSSPFNYSLVTVPKAPITIGIIFTFMFHISFNSLAKSRYLSFFLFSFSFVLWSASIAKSTILQGLECKRDKSNFSQNLNPDRCVLFFVGGEVTLTLRSSLIQIKVLYCLLTFHCTNRFLSVLTLLYIASQPFGLRST